MLEISVSVFLFWTVLLPFQNYEQLTRLLCGGALLWFLAFLFRPSRNLISSSVLFHFSLLMTFYARAILENGFLNEWYFWIALFHWAGVLRFSERKEDPAGPSLFLIACLISPLSFFTLNAAGQTFSGFWLWTLLLLRVTWVMFCESEQTCLIPWYLVAFLLICLVSIPFSSYSWRNLQFLMVNCVCVAAYIMISNRQDRTPLLVGYLVSSIVLIAFAYSREIAALHLIGSSALRMRLSIVQFHNDLVPTFIIYSVMLVRLLRTKFRGMRWEIAFSVCLALLALLEFLTYSRNGWFAYLLFVFVFLFLHGKKLLLIPAAAAVCVLLTLGVVRTEFKERLTNSNSVKERTFNWKAGLLTVAEHPLFGVGWMNFYTHSKLPDGISTFANLEENQKLTTGQTHSMLLDLAETGGVSLAVLFVFILAKHMKFSGAPAVTAGIAAIALNCVGDSACLWLPVYPHVWILLGFAASGTATKAFHIPYRRSVVLALLLFALVMLVEDRSLRLGSFYHRTNLDDRAFTQARIARLAAPMDTAPLELLREISLTREDSAEAARILQKMISKKKDYAPYYTELGRIEMLQGRYQESARSLETAVRLDPYSGLDGNPYVYLMLLSEKLANRKNFESYRQRAFLLRFKSGSLLSAKSLWTKENLDQVLEDTEYITASQEDWITAIENIQNNCRVLGKPELAEQALEHAIRKARTLPTWAVDDFSNELGELYAAREKTQKIPALIALCTEPAASALKARWNIARGNLDQAYNDLRKSTKLFRYDEIADLWSAYYTKAKKLTDLRKHFEIMEKLPIPFSPSWRWMIANSYLEENKYRSAAIQFHRVSQYHYDDPYPHWREARCWWLADRSKEARDANDRLQKLIISNWFTSNLYRSYMIRFLWDGSGISNISLPNAAGGLSRRTAIYAHPPFAVIFPEDGAPTEIHSEVALLADVWEQDTDGVTFGISNYSGKGLTSMNVDPKNNPQHRRWNRFDWKSSGKPEAITLNTQPRANSSYDWAVWAFEQ